MKRTATTLAVVLSVAATAVGTSTASTPKLVHGGAYRGGGLHGGGLHGGGLHGGGLHGGNEAAEEAAY
jgi:hypothetical protein